MPLETPFIAGDTPPAVHCITYPYLAYIIASRGRLHFVAMRIKHSSQVRIETPATHFSLQRQTKERTECHEIAGTSRSHSSSGVKRPGPEADHSPLSNTEVKNIWSYASTLPEGLYTFYHRHILTGKHREILCPKHN